MFAGRREKFAFIHSGETQSELWKKNPFPQIFVWAVSLCNRISRFTTLFPFLRQRLFSVVMVRVWFTISINLFWICIGKLLCCLKVVSHPRATIFFCKFSDEKQKKKAENFFFKSFVFTHQTDDASFRRYFTVARPCWESHRHNHRSKKLPKTFIFYVSRVFIRIYHQLLMFPKVSPKL